MRFERFDPAAVALLAELPGWDADTYAANKEVLSAGVVTPGRALIGQLAADLEAELTVTARGSVSPLHRDLRFAPPDTPRYKDHLLLTTWQGDDKKTAPMLWLRIDASRAGFASGIGFTPAIRERWREAIGGPAGAALADELERLVRERHAEVAGDRVKRVPAPFPPDHPRADLLRATGFQVRFTEPLPAELDGAPFLDWCREGLAAVLPVHHWLVANLTDHGEPAGEELFWELVDELRAADPRVAEGTIMGGPCVRVGDEFLALVGFKNQGMVVKLPRQRVAELIDGGVGRPFAPAGKVFKEWVAVPVPDPDLWASLLREGVAFVGS